MKQSTQRIPGNLQAKQRYEADDKVISAIEANEKLSRAQLVELTGFDDEAVRRAMDRLRDAGMIRRLEEKGPSGSNGRRAALYALGAEEDSPLVRMPTQVLINRHPQDVAFFGEYRRAA